MNTPHSTRPYFVPADVDWQALPEGVRAAALAILEPAYRELVLEAASALERAAGVSIVHLLFLELLEQCEIGRGIGERVAAGAEGLAPRDQEIERHLRLVAAKTKTGKFLVQIKEHRRKHPHVHAPLPED